MSRPPLLLPPPVAPSAAGGLLSSHARSVSVLAWRAVDQTVENGARRYVRARHLPPLLAFAAPPRDMPEPDATRMVLAGLRRRLGSERRRARAMPHHYDLNRHIALLQALRAETRHWQNLRKK